MLKIKVSAIVASLLLVTIPVAAQSNSAPLSGCVQKSGGVYTLVDENSKNTVQLRGGHLKAGQHVQVTGTVATGTPGGGASQLFDVANVTPTGGTCPGSGGRHLSKAHVISIALVGGLVVFGLVVAAGRIGPSF